MINDNASSMSFRDAITGALRYWEPRRLLFNAALLAVVVACFVVGWPGSMRVLTFELILGLFVLAVLANIAYCAAYIPDVIIQQSAFREYWLRWRWILLWLGILFASSITYFFAAGMFGVGPNANGN